MWLKSVENRKKTIVFIRKGKTHIKHVKKLKDEYKTMHIFLKVVFIKS